MIDRAALAGMAVGVGLLLAFEQVFTNTPSWAALAVGGFLFAIGGVAWGDLRDQQHERLDRRAETDR